MPRVVRLLAGVVFAAIVVLLSLGVPGFLYSLLEKDFLPEEDKGRFIAWVITPEGSTPEYTDRMLAECEKIMRETPEVEIYGSIVAPSFSGPGLANNGIAFVKLKDKRKRGIQEIVNAPDGLRLKFFNEIEGALAMPMIPKAIGRSFTAPFSLVIQGQDLDGLNTYVTDLVNKLRQSGYLLNVRSSFEVNKPELQLGIDRNRAAALGVSIEDISRTLQIMFGGVDLSRIKLEGKEYFVMAQLKRESRLTPQNLDGMYVRNFSNELVQLSSVVTRQAGAAPNAIEHHNRLRSATITGTPVGIPLGSAINRAEEMLKGDLPAGFLHDWSGESKDFKDAGREVWFVLILALIIVYMVLASQFESLIHPFTVILAVPLAAVGAFGLLWLIHVLMPAVPAMNMNLFSQIGLILLVGLVTKNSILLVEFANQQRHAGVNPYEAMVQAGIVRLRPILMTAFSTIAGIIPIAIGFGAGAESRRPMGVAVVGGMLTSTFLTLIIIPIVYVAFSELAAGLGKKKTAEAPAPLPAPEPI